MTVHFCDVLFRLFFTATLDLKILSSELWDEKEKFKHQHFRKNILSVKLITNGSYLSKLKIEKIFFFLIKV